MASVAKADLALQDADRNTALHLACSKVKAFQRQEMLFSHSVLKMLQFSCGLSVSDFKLKVVTIQILYFCNVWDVYVLALALGTFMYHFGHIWQTHLTTSSHVSLASLKGTIWRMSYYCEQ